VRLQRKLFVFDCDGVLIESKSSWRILHDYFGSRDNSYFAKLYEQGLISYLDWMKIDIALMIHSYGKPITKRDIEKAFSTVKVRPGARLVVEKLKERGHVTAVVSSGVDVLVERVCREIGVDVCIYNELLYNGEEIIPGGVAKVPLREKKHVIEKLARELGLGLENTVYIGDSEWDIEVFKSVGASIAVEPCGEACKHALYVVRRLEEILELGIA
jgi:phosphoserine phosphatase